MSTTLHEKVINIKSISDQTTDTEICETEIKKISEIFQNEKVTTDDIRKLLEEDHSLTEFLPFVFAIVEREDFDISMISDKDERQCIFVRAAKYGSPSMIQLLVEKGFDINSVNHMDDTALITCMDNLSSSTQEREEIALALLHKEADPSLGHYGINAICVAALRGYKKFLEAIIYLHKGKYKHLVNERDHFCGWTPVYHVSITERLDEKQKIEILNILIKEGGAKIDIEDCYYETPLYYAASNLYVDVVDHFLHLKAKFNPIMLITGLIKAVKSKEKNYIRYFLSIGANPCYGDIHDQFPILVAKKFEDQEIYNILLTHMNLHPHKWTEALNYVTLKIHYEDYEIIEYLLESGANPIEKINGKSAFDICLERGKHEAPIKKLFIEHIPNTTNKKSKIEVLD